MSINVVAKAVVEVVAIATAVSLTISLQYYQTNNNNGKTPLMSGLQHGKDTKHCSAHFYLHILTGNIDVQ